MARTTNSQLLELVSDLRDQLARLTQRVAQLEGPAAVLAPSAEAPKVAAPAAESEIPEEELLAISAALAAYLGVRVHIRQIRLIGSGAWAQEGRASIQASHRLHS